MPLQPGQTFARYTIEDLLGAGGMGEVYRAHDTTLRRKVALKVIHPDLQVPDAAERLVREARAAAALSHPNTIAIHDLGETDGVVYLVMELVSGVPLRVFVGDTSVPAVKKLRWLVDVARGLAAAHRAGLVHRDVKPTNVMVSDEGMVKVLDFGLARPVEGASARTDVNLVVGTPRYMAPELFSGLPADARSDEYAFGVTAYELLTGMYPGGPTGALPAALDTIVPEVGPAVARVIGRTLSRGRDERYPTMEEVADALDEACPRDARLGGGPVGGTPATKREGASRGATALALAPTELSPTELSPAAGTRTSAPPSTRPPATARKPSVAGILAVLGLVSFAGVYVATRFSGAEAGASGSVAVDASASGRELEVDEDAGAAPEPAAPSVVDAIEEADAGDAGADAGDADVGPDASPSPFLDEEFPDPWLRPKR